MKIGKQHKRAGPPSEKFLAIQRARAAAAAAPPPGSPLHIHLDDERPCPPGWTQVRTASALADAIATGGPDIQRLSLDWHLGSGVPDGREVARRLAADLRADHDHLPALEVVTFHSSDRMMAGEMLRIVHAALVEAGRDDVMLDVGQPWTGDSVGSYGVRSRRR